MSTISSLFDSLFSMEEYRESFGFACFSELSLKGVVVDSVWRGQRALIGLKLHAGTSEDISDD